jgi:hypothetical protein
MLEDMNRICGHINYRKNIRISHESFFGKSIMKLRKVEILSALIMQNFFIKKIYSYSEDNLFNFINLNSTRQPEDEQYFGFFLNWQYVYSERDTAVIDIIKLIEDKTKEFNLIKTKKRLVIHVRRGDFLTRGNEEILGIIHPDSYKFLIDSIVKQEPELEIYTITDDDNLANNKDYGSEFGKILSRYETNEWQALRLMIDADYVIAANSTFSWWGAALAYFKSNSTCFIPEKFYKNLDDRESFKLPGLKTYKNIHL